MNRFHCCFVAMCIPLLTCSAASNLAPVTSAMKNAVSAGQVSGAVTLVVSRQKVLHQEAVGWSDIAKQEPMRPDSLFWIASMTKPVTATALLMLQDEGKLN